MIPTVLINFADAGCLLVTNLDRRGLLRLSLRLSDVRTESRQCDVEKAGGILSNGVGQRRGRFLASILRFRSLQDSRLSFQPKCLCGACLTAI